MIELNTNNETKKRWFLFDGRYIVDANSATLFEVCETYKEAKKNQKEYGDDTVIVECEIFNDTIVSSRMIEPRNIL